MEIPELGPDGRYLTINRDLNEDELVWHFRSGWNVAALNCTAPRYQPIVDAYSAYIRDHKETLKQVYDRLEQAFRDEAGTRREGIFAREEHMTSVYNFWALPPARSGFCRTALDMSNRYLASPPADPVGFAKLNFALLEDPFEKFFAEYQNYQSESAKWDAKWGAQYGYSQPGYVAAQKARAAGVAVPVVGQSTPETMLAAPVTQAGAVVDTETGVAVPVVPVDEDVVSQPVTQPIPGESGADAQNDPEGVTPAPNGLR